MDTTVRHLIGESLSEVPSNLDVAGAYGLYAEELTNFARLNTSSSEAADVVQTVFAAAIGRWASIEHVRAYLWRSTVNELAKRSRREGLRRRLMLGFRRDAEYVENFEYLDDILEGLARQSRQVLILRFYFGLSVKECAVALDIAPGTVKSTTSRAVAQMRGEIDE